MNAVRKPPPRRSGEPAEDPDYLSRQLVTYIGSKRALLGPIGAALEHVKRRLGKNRLRMLDAFSGSGVVSRFFKAHACWLAACDLENYAAILGRCFLANRSLVSFTELDELVRSFNAVVGKAGFPPGFIQELYAPADENAITATDRVFYTKANARRLDDYRRLIATAPAQYRDLLLGPLLGRASVHANTAGVFKGFYKNRQTRIGQFGGSKRDALNRILGRIELESPLLSRFECEHEVFQGDINQIARRLPELDIAYLDPPYNQHPYGSNYFMLNLLADYERPQNPSPVSGIPADWNRSGYNIRGQSLALMRDLVDSLPARYLLVSFNGEGFIPPPEMRAMLSEYGTVDVMDFHYNAFRGSRSFANRSIHVTEYLFLVEKKS